ncbi:hypothetical protein PDJAM_G00063490, partial [Pangasius djambal]|nr:hypothetical protein [Pangasius djambal]
ERTSTHRSQLSTALATLCGNCTTEAKEFLLPNQTSVFQGTYFYFIIILKLFTWIRKHHHKGCRQGEGLYLPHPGSLLP